MSTPASARAEEPGFRNAVGALLGRVVRLAQTRIELAGIDLQEQREHFTQTVVALAVAGVCFALALIVATFGVIALFWDTHRYAAIAAVCVVYAGVGLVFLGRYYRLRRDSPAPFAATLRELERDRRAIVGKDA
jgi:uncharacterized membrane protein YqjE